MNVKYIWICPLLFHLRFDFKKYDFDARATLPKLGSDLLAPRVYNGGFKEKEGGGVIVWGSGSEAAAPKMLRTLHCTLEGPVDSTLVWG